jgi:hypothetical protein
MADEVAESESDDRPAPIAAHRSQESKNDECGRGRDPG